MTATPVLRAIRTILEIFVANLKIALGVNPIVFNGEPRLNHVPSLLERGLNLHFPPKIRQIFPPCDKCDIKNGRKQVKKFGQPWLTLTVQFWYMYINCCYFGVAVRPKNFLPLFFFFFFSLFPDEDKARRG